MVLTHQACKAAAGAQRVATMFTRPDDLKGMLLEARAVRDRWMIEARHAVERSDDDREVACEYQLCLIDGLIALIQRELVH